jgi:hypothetical protein
MDVEADELNLLPAELDVKTFQLNCLEVIDLERKNRLVGELKTLVKTRKHNNTTLANEIDSLAVKIQFEERKVGPPAESKLSCD